MMEKIKKEDNICRKLEHEIITISLGFMVPNLVPCFKSMYLTHQDALIASSRFFFAEALFFFKLPLNANNLERRKKKTKLQ